MLCDVCCLLVAARCSLCVACCLFVVCCVLLFCVVLRCLSFVAVVVC